MPVSNMFAPNVNRTTIAAQGRGSVKVLVQREKDSFEAIATEFFFSRSVRTWNSSSAPRRLGLRASPATFRTGREALQRAVGRIPEPEPLKPRRPLRLRDASSSVTSDDSE